MVARSAFLIFSVVLIFGCGGTIGVPEWTETVLAYLPYVEEITTSPESLVEGEPFTMTIELSAALRPEILNDADIKSHYIVERPPGSERDGIFRTFLSVETWAIEPSLAGEPISSIVVEMPGLPEGIFYVNLYSADRREYGGLESKYVVGTTNQPLSHEHIRYDQYKFDVLPAEGGGGE